MISNGIVRVSTHVVDVANLEHVKRYASEVIKTHKGVHLLINNAGVSVIDTIEDVSYDDSKWLMGINLWGVIYGCKEFLPYLKQQNEAHIVNISSVNGIFTNPNNGAYCTSKFAVRGFTETLCQEMKATKVKVSCVDPGGSGRTSYATPAFIRCRIPLGKEETVRLFDRFLVHTSADKAAKIIISGIKKNKHRIMVGPDAYVCDWLKRLFPVNFQKIISNKKVSLRMKKKIGSRE